MTARELELAKKAAAPMLRKPALKPLNTVRRKSSYICRGIVEALSIRLHMANEEYEEGKVKGVRIEDVEKKYNLKKRSLNNWRHNRMKDNKTPVKRMNKLRMKT